MTAAKSPTLRDIVIIIFNYRWSILTIFLTSIVVALAYCMVISPMYRAETKILVKMGRENFAALDNGPKESYNVLFQERSQNIHNELEMSKGPYFTEVVFSKLKDDLMKTAQPGEMKFFQKIKSSIREGIRKTRDFLYEPVYYLGLAKRLSQDEEL